MVLLSDRRNINLIDFLHRHYKLTSSVIYITMDYKETNQVIRATTEDRSRTELSYKVIKYKVRIKTNYKNIWQRMLLFPVKISSPNCVLDLTCLLVAASPCLRQPLSRFVCLLLHGSSSDLHCW